MNKPETGVSKNYRGAPQIKDASLWRANKVPLVREIFPKTLSPEVQGAGCRIRACGFQPETLNPKVEEVSV